MAYFARIPAGGVTRPSVSRWNIHYEIVNDANGSVVDTGDYGATFGHIMEDPNLTAQARLRFILDPLEAHLRAHIDTIRIGDGVFAGFKSAVEGRRYPPA